METIRMYLDQMFKDLPKSKEVVELKLNLLDHMEEKYNELREAGKSEAEASRFVINEFGDMNEILSELDIDIMESPTADINYIDSETADRFIQWRGKFAFAIAIGVIFCIMAVAVSSLLEDILLPQSWKLVSFIPFFVLVAIGVSIFICFGIMDEKYEKMMKKAVLDRHKKQEIEKRLEAERIPFAIMIAIGVVLCIMAVASYPLMEFIGLKEMDSFVFFTLVSIGVFLFIVAGIRQERYEILLKEIEEYEAEEIVGRYSGIIMLSATAIYLFSGFVFDAWGTMWIVFPLGGILCGIVSIIILKGKEK